MTQADSPIRGQISAQEGRSRVEGPLSLSYRRQSVPLPTDESERACPNNPDPARVLVNLETYEMRTLRCRRNRCWWCGPINAMQTAQAIEVAGPERRFDLTLVGDDWQTVRSRMKRFTYEVRHRGGKWNACWHVERNPKGTGHHVHGIQWGEFVSFKVLRESAIRSGMGSRCRIEAITNEHRAAYYGLKHAASAYGLKLAREEESLLEYLDLNGERMVHASRGFWRDGEGGVPLGGKRDAVSLAASRLMAMQDGEGRWVMCLRSNLAEVLRKG